MGNEAFWFSLSVIDRLVKLVCGQINDVFPGILDEPVRITFIELYTKRPATFR
jgi:hypothetical protein